MNNKVQKTNRTGSNGASRTQQEYSRILTAAVINNQFRKLLLTNPAKAIEIGYGGEMFTLAREEKRRVAEIHATSLADFASQLSQALDYGMAVAAGD
jgi:hypothetical protein